MVAELLQTEIPTTRDIDEELNRRLIQEQAELHNASYLEWLRFNFPHVITKPFSQRHIEFWAWIEALTLGVKPRARAAIWPRGGGKSATAELGCVRAGVLGKRRFALYVSGTQDQADHHVASIASYLERLGAKPLVSKFGNVKGWRRNFLRTADGFNVLAIGLDAGVRGIKLDELRPDLTILDDIDDQRDSPAVISKNIDTLTSAILPMGSPDVGVLVVQNLVHYGGIVHQIVTCKARFLHGIEVSKVEPAAYDLTVEGDQLEDGSFYYRVTGGTPTWEGQDLAVIEYQINDWGWLAFQREAQQEVEPIDGNLYKAAWFHPMDGPPPNNENLVFVRYWDLAVTIKTRSARTAGVKVAVDPYTGWVWIADAVFGKWEYPEAAQVMIETAISDGKNVRIAYDERGVGKPIVQQLRKDRRMLGYPMVETNFGTKDKIAVAMPLINQGAQSGIFMTRAAWNDELIRECLAFYNPNRPCDIADALAGAFKVALERSGPRKDTSTPAPRPGTKEYYEALATSQVPKGELARWRRQAGLVSNGKKH